MTTTAWFDAADVSSITEDISSGGVVQWNDKSGNENHLRQESAAYQLTTKNVGEYINGRNTMVSNNASQNRMVLTNDIARNTANTAIFWVARADDTTNGLTNGIIEPTQINNRWGILNKNNFAYRFLGTALQWNFSSIGKTWGSGEVHIGEHWNESTQLYGGLDGSITTGPTDLNTSPFGWRHIPSFSYSSSWRGAIGEVIIINTDAVSLSDRQKIEGYLAHKWGIADELPVSHPYKEFAP